MTCSFGRSTCEVHVLGQFSLGFCTNRRNHYLLTQRERYIYEVKCVVIY